MSNNTEKTGYKCPENHIECPRCKGYGKEKPTDYLGCWECSGNGFVNEIKSTKKCQCIDAITSLKSSLLDVENQLKTISEKADDSFKVSVDFALDIISGFLRNNFNNKI